jgi:hypothetical protein
MHELIRTYIHPVNHFEIGSNMVGSTSEESTGLAINRTEEN